jgi:flagellar biosynthesis protein FlhF
VKIKRFFAKDMRAALAQVKETLGSDAVIMSNKKVTGGIEIVAAVDYDEPKATIASQAPTTSFMDVSEDQVSLGAKPAMKAQSKVNSPAAADSLQALLEKQHNRMTQQMSVRQDEPELPEWARQLQGAKPANPASNLPLQSVSEKPTKNNKNHSGDMDELREEMASLRSLLTHQVSSLMKDQKKRTDPVGAMLESKLIAAEFSPAVAAKLAGLSQHYTPADLVRALPQSLANLLDNQGDDIVKRGGVVAFVGPKGFGKKT